MSGPDLKQLSSNWKKLQEKLKTEKKKEPAQNNGLKRKREPTKATSNGINKKTRLSRPESKPRKMGGYFPTPSTSHNDLIKDHDIDPSSITAAYGPSTTPKPTTYTDTLNSGLHPTHKLGKFIALDCEMVGTGPPPHADNVLARASLVNFNGEQIYDTYVLPPPGIPVNDYRTFVSGIKPHHLRPGYARPFAEVQKDVATILDGRVLVGHALRNDLNVLMLSHPKRDLRDTSRYAKFRVESGGRPPALRKLAKSELGLEIQGGEHSSVEDARTTMALYRQEKKGFEEENRRRFGNGGRKSEMVEKGSPSVEDESEDDEDQEDDLELLEGEEDDEILAEDGLSVNRTAQPKGKKKKKKKRTKRK